MKPDKHSFVIGPQEHAAKRKLKDYEDRFKTGPVFEQWVAFIKANGAKVVAAEIMQSQETFGDMIRDEKK